MSWLMNRMFQGTSFYYRYTNHPICNTHFIDSGGAPTLAACSQAHKHSPLCTRNLTEASKR